ncbi:hypothetical protein SDC9_187154 [bioreactor metagenome]|uniref:Uncharacterized protein n=1 Tax=bioreactor metagenome TaxID=1076179 RepID=A0A645HM54_9ZZZZ
MVLYIIIGQYGVEHLNIFLIVFVNIRNEFNFLRDENNGFFFIVLLVKLIGCKPEKAFGVFCLIGIKIRENQTVLHIDCVVFDVQTL